MTDKYENRMDENGKLTITITGGKEAIMTQSQFIKIYGIPGTVEAISCGNPADASAFAVYQTITQFPALSLTVTDLRTLRATNFQRRTCTY